MIPVLRPALARLFDLDSTWHEIGHVGIRMALVGLLVLVVFFVLVLPGCMSPSAETVLPIRIGYQKWGTCSILKSRGTLETALTRLGGSVEWIEFPSGPPLLEALNAGGIDFGHTGDSPPIFAQAAGVPLVYVGASTPCPENSGIVVAKDSPIKTLADLKGRKIAFTKGSSAHTMILRALAQVDLTLADIEPAYLSAADGRAAMQAGSVDAWSIWDPYLALAEQEGEMQLLAGGEGLVAGREYYLASREFLLKRPEMLALLIRELNTSKRWASENPAAAAKFLASLVGLDEKVAERAEKRSGRYGVENDEAVIIAEQQRLADDYLALGLLPSQIDVRTAVKLIQPASDKSSAETD